jgi:hypothetical protein
MADAKSFRTKELSKMSVDELKKFVKDVQGAGIKGSKEVDKAINLLKVQQPERYGAKTVASAKTSLQTQSSIPTLQKLGIAVPDWKQQQASLGSAVGAAGVASTGTSGLTSGLSSGMTSGISSSNPYQTPEIQSAQKEIDTITAAKNKANDLINDNPFYSEATRVGKIAKLNEKYNADLTLAQNKLTTAQTNAQNAYKVQQDALANNREIFKTYVSTGALAGATEAELQTISKATGYPIGIIRGAITQIKLDQASKNKPKELSSSEKIIALNQSTTAAFQGMKTNPQTGKLEKVLGDDQYASPEDWKRARQGYMAKGGSLKDFNDEFWIYVNPDIKELYGISGKYFD